MKDLKFNIHVCIKVYKSSPYFQEIAKEEIKNLGLIYQKSKEKSWINKFKELKNRFDLDNINTNENFCVDYLNSFVHEGPNGNHYCIVYEYLWITLDEFLKNTKIEEIPYSSIKKIFL